MENYKKECLSIDYTLLSSPISPIISLDSNYHRIFLNCEDPELSSRLTLNLALNWCSKHDISCLYITLSSNLSNISSSDSPFYQYHSIVNRIILKYVKNIEELHSYLTHFHIFYNKNNLSNIPQLFIVDCLSQLSSSHQWNEEKDQLHNLSFIVYLIRNCVDYCKTLSSEPCHLLITHSIPLYSLHLLHIFSTWLTRLWQVSDVDKDDIPFEINTYFPKSYLYSPLFLYQIDELHFSTLQSIGISHYFLKSISTKQIHYLHSKT